MNTIYNYNQNNKATVCADKNCVAVYGEMANIVNGIAIVTVAFVGLALLAKALR